MAPRSLPISDCGRGGKAQHIEPPRLAGAVCGMYLFYT